MILEVVADGKIDDGLDAHGAQMRRWPNSRQHQQLRTVEGATAEDDLTVRVSAFLGAPADVLDSNRRSPFQDQPGGVRRQRDMEVTATSRGLQISGGGRGAPPIPDRVLDPGKPFLVLAVGVAGDGIAGRAARIRPRLENRIRRPRELDLQGTASAAPGVLAALPSLASLEIRKHLGI